MQSKPPHRYYYQQETILKDPEDSLGLFSKKSCHRSVSVEDYLSQYPVPNPTNCDTWLFIHRSNHHPSRGICSYCLELEDDRLYVRQKELIVTQLQDKENAHASYSDFNSYTLMAEAKAEEFVNYLRRETKLAEEERCLREYMLERVESLDEYTLAKMIPGIDAEQVKHEWDQYLSNMKKNVKKQLFKQKIKRVTVKMLRLGF
ncbi:hypothetical protein V1511DRAFT_457099 [Dipodascopsis uninucleata]